MLAGKLRARRHVLPVEQPIHELRRTDGFNLFAEGSQRQPMDPGEKPAVAPFHFFRGTFRESSAQDRAARLELKQNLVGFDRGNAQQPGKRPSAHGTGVLEPAVHERPHGIVFFGGGALNRRDGGGESGIRENLSKGFCFLCRHPVRAARDFGAPDASLRQKLIEVLLPGQEGFANGILKVSKIRGVLIRKIRRRKTLVLPEG